MKNETLRIVAMCLLYRRLLRRRDLRRLKVRRRSCWVNPINQSREEDGTFAALVQELREDEDKFFDYFRMSVPTFDELHEKLKSQIQHVNTNMRNSIPSEVRLAVTLRYLATGSSFSELHHSFRLGLSTTRNIVKEVCVAIWTVLGEESIPRLSKERFESIAYGFEKNANFPLCLGALGGKDIRIKSSKCKEPVDHHSVALMAVADTNYQFVYVDVQSLEKDCDTSFFKRSTLWKSIILNELQLEQKYLPRTESSTLPGTGSFTFPKAESFTFPETESFTFPKTECSTFPETESFTFPETESFTFPKTECSTFTGTECSTFPGTECSTFPGTECSTFPGTECSTFPGTECSTFPKAECSTFPGTECSTLPKAECSTFPRTESYTFPGTESFTFPKTECSTFPETECSTYQEPESFKLQGPESFTLPGTESFTLPGTVSSKFPGPESSTLLWTESSKFPYFFVGDKTFGLHQHLMRPYCGKKLTLEKKVFNFRLLRAQRYVECAFGILCNKWHIFQGPLNVSSDFAVEITKACVVLHNFVLNRDGFSAEDTKAITGLKNLEEEHYRHASRQANTVRDSLRKYFVTVGAVPWQNQGSSGP